MLVNRTNFLRFDDLTTPPTVPADLPNGYIRDAGRCNYRPLLVAGEAQSFYINIPEGLAFTPDPATHKLALIRSQGNVIVNADVAPLQVDTFTVGVDTKKTVYAEVIIDGTVAAGAHYYQIKNGATILLQSNEIYVVPAGTEHLAYSVLAKFRHDRYFYGVNYQNLAGFYQQFRLHMNEIDDQFDEDKEVYNEVTTGKQRTFNNFMKELSTVETYYFDKYAHEAAAVLFDHEEVYLNLKRYTAKGVYKKDFNKISKVFKGSIDVYKEEFASANRCVSS